MLSQERNQIVKCGRPVQGKAQGTKYKTNKVKYEFTINPKAINYALIIIKATELACHSFLQEECEPYLTKLAK